LIFSGLQTENWIRVLVGCLASAALALAEDALLGLVERGVAARSRWRLGLGIGALMAGLGLALIPAGGGATAQRPVVVGAKNFSEPYILAEALVARLEAAGFATAARTGRGSSVAYRALAAGEINAYVDYSGT